MCMEKPFGVIRQFEKMPKTADNFILVYLHKINIMLRNIARYQPIIPLM